jgi:hypothetical protein
MSGNQIRILVAGFIGGIATPAIQPIQAFLKTHHYPSDFTLGFWLFSGCLGVVGLVLVWLMQETDVKKALALGASLPAFFTSLGGAVQNDQKLSDATAKVTMSAPIERSWAEEIAPLFVSTAAAQTSPSATASASPAPSNRTATITRKEPFAYKLEVLNADGKPIEPARDVNVLVPSPLKLALPDNAATLRFTTDGGGSWMQQLNAGAGDIDITLSGDDFRRHFDVQQLFGKTPDLVPNRLKAEAAERP